MRAIRQCAKVDSNVALGWVPPPFCRRSRFPLRDPRAGPPCEHCRGRRAPSGSDRAPSVVQARRAGPSCLSWMTAVGGMGMRAMVTFGGRCCKPHASQEAVWLHG